LPREWDGSGKYNKVATVGKGAFAVVYKVTSKFNGNPYAAKELDKKRFVKNGVLDQKIDNEMKIMQRVRHVSVPDKLPPGSCLTPCPETHRRVHRAFRLGRSLVYHHYAVRIRRRLG
jgi:serine/threonine protein kinase